MQKQKQASGREKRRRTRDRSEAKSEKAAERQRQRWKPEANSEQTTATLGVSDPTPAKTDDDLHGDDNGKVIDTTALLRLIMPSTNFTLPFLHIPEHLRPCRCRRTSGKDVGANFKRFEQLITLTTDSASAYCSQC